MLLKYVLGDIYTRRVRVYSVHTRERLCARTLDLPASGLFVYHKNVKHIHIYITVGICLLTICIYLCGPDHQIQLVAQPRTLLLYIAIKLQLY